MHSTRLPGIIALPELSPFMLCPMISTPASPKPRARSEPILMMVFSSTAVSIGSGSPLLAGRNLLVQRSSRRFCRCAKATTLCTKPTNLSTKRPAPEVHSPDRWLSLLMEESPVVLRLKPPALLVPEISREKFEPTEWFDLVDLSLRALLSSQDCWTSRSRSLSPMCSAAIGFFRILFSLVIMLSIGMSTSLLVSFEKTIAPRPRSRQMKMVWLKFSTASRFEPRRRSKTKIQNSCFASSSVTHRGVVGITTRRSW
mmetsp:Transcript_64288/g.188619  ORF Transcript_64288/g.188619 Transcript_64288/m.188619 type:complete len:256 (+) Transcript_64288:220-987(+)